MLGLDRFVINTIVYQTELDKGGSQSVCLANLAQLDVQNVEVRREYIRSDQDLMLINDTAKSLGQKLFYSIPDQLFIHGRLNQPALQIYIKEAISLEAEMVKFNVGEFTGWTAELVQEFKTIIKDYKGIVTVENDQTKLNGKMKALLLFLSETKAMNIPIYSTFDIGNVCWVGENPLESASKASPYTKLVHMKDVVLEETGPRATFLGNGIIPWNEILAQFDTDVYVALEYPCGDTPDMALKAELAKVIFRK